MPDLIKVAKFGGTSMADAGAMRRCARIVSMDPDKRLIVVSATSGTTNMLTAISESESEEERNVLVEQVRDKHVSIVQKLKDPGKVQPVVDQLLDELKFVAIETDSFDSAATDKMLAFGEKLSSAIFNGILNEEGVDSELFDVQDVMVTDNVHGNAEPNLRKIKSNVEQKLTRQVKTGRFVTQGFVGVTEDGRTTTLGRGGSDFSAALLAEALDADVLEIWTDVSAVYTTDPRLVSEARPITEISFNEAAELSVFGAKVLHPATLKPAIRKNIKVYVGSSIKPDEPGTWIVKDTREVPVIRAITLRRQQTLLTVHSLEMLHRRGFLARLFQVLADHKISVDLVTTSEVSVSLTLDTNYEGAGPARLSEALLRDLQEIADVKIEKGLALVALVGNNLDSTAGVSGPIFSALGDINIRLICHGASSNNLCFLVEEEEAAETVQKLHNRFITNKKEN